MGRLVVIDGLDGSGKSTQLARLNEYLSAAGVSYKQISFPDYAQPSSALVKMYLAGELGGSADAVNAYAASTFYAVDRFASYRQDWGEYYEQGGLILSDRYTTSNAVHQTTKEPPEKRQAFLHWLYDFEYDRLGLPQPDLVIYLDVPTDFTEKLLRSREAATHTQADIHEQDTAYLAACREVGRAAADFYGWKTVQCVRDGAMRSIADIHQEIYRCVSACLEG